MSARQRGPPPSSSRSTNPSYGYSRQTPTDDREAVNNDPYAGDRYLNSRGGGQRDFFYDANDSRSQVRTSPAETEPTRTSRSHLKTHGFHGRKCPPVQTSLEQ